MTLILYLLAGLVTTFLLEIAVRSSGESVSFTERLWMIVGWPVMVLVFIIHFIKGFLGND